MAHTPGPWSVMPTPTDAQHTHKIMYDCVQERRRIGAVCGVFAKDNGEATDNARLIAAAPALLAALKAHLPWHTEPVQGWGAWADAVHAIEQAEGVTMEGTNGKERSLD